MGLYQLLWISLQILPSVTQFSEGVHQGIIYFLASLSLIACYDSLFTYYICVMYSHLQPAQVSVKFIKTPNEERSVMREVWVCA